MDEGAPSGSGSALDVLIRSAWIEGEARERGIAVTAKQVNSARDEERTGGSRRLEAG